MLRLIKRVVLFRSANRDGFDVAALNKFLEPFLYFHRWSPNEQLLVDDEEMVHGRIPMTTKLPNSGGYLLQSHLHWDDEGSLKTSPLY